MPHAVLGAKSITFITDKNLLQSDESMTVTASSSGFSSEELIYIKGSFYKNDENKNYFGYTKKEDSWVDNSKILEQRQVKIGEWDNILLVKPDPVKYNESGTYKFKVGFYTLKSNGEPNSVDWSDTIIDIVLEKRLPTETPKPTPTNTPRPSLTSTVTVKPSSTSTPTITKKPTPTEEINTNIEEDVLGVEEEITPVPELKHAATSSSPFRLNNNYKNAGISLLFIGAGSGLLSAAFLGKKLFRSRQTP